MQIVIEPIAVDATTAAAMLGGIGRSTFLERVSRRELPRPRKIGARSVWLVEELMGAARGLPVEDCLPRAVGIARLVVPEGDFSSSHYVTIKGAAASIGLSEGAIRKRIERGIWLLGKHYRKAPDGRIYIDMRAIEAWGESSTDSSEE